MGEKQMAVTTKIGNIHDRKILPLSFALKGLLADAACVGTVFVGLNFFFLLI
jgi:hypothetical protein